MYTCQITGKLKSVNEAWGFFFKSVFSYAQDTILLIKDKLDLFSPGVAEKLN